MGRRSTLNGPNRPGGSGGTDRPPASRLATSTAPPPGDIVLPATPDQPNGRNVRKGLRVPGWGCHAGGMLTRHAVATLTVAAAALAGFAPAAGAADQPPTIRSIDVHDVRVDAAGCRDIPVTIRFADHGWRVSGINSKVFHDGEQVGYLAASPADADATSARTSAKWCASSGLGRYVVGPSTITYYNPGGAGTKSVDDATTGAFTVRRDSRIRLGAHPVSDHVATVTARLRGYSLTADRYRGVRGVTMLLQTKRAGEAWSTVDSAVTGAHGQVELSGHGRQLWRIVSQATSTVAKARSAAFS